MAVFRVEKQRNYTVMSNHHLNDRNLSLKAKGLLSLMLSLPEDWDYTTQGLAYICKEGRASISATIQELEANGYVIRERIRNSNGQLGAIEYTILEQPREMPPKSENPAQEKPMLDKPAQGLPAQEKPVQENRAQSNTNKPITKKQNTNSQNTQSLSEAEDVTEDEIYDLREAIREQIDYRSLCQSDTMECVDELVEIMLEVAMCRSPSISVGRNMEYPAEMVKDRFRQLNAEHIEKVLDGIKETTSRVRNTRNYLLAALFNAPATISSYYTMRVNHDLYGNNDPPYTG